MATGDVAVNRDHKTIVREEFTRQADSYASAAIITDEDRLAKLVAAINPSVSDRAIEVATGPGYVAMALAKRCAEVVGVDLTEAPLKIAERTRQQRVLGNVSFRTGDAENLPFGDAEFDIAVCRFAFHHFEEPARVLGEMCRVCRPGATIAVEDLYSSEVAERSNYYNHFERLRDHSHTRALPPSGLIALLARSRVEIQRLYSDELVVDVESWLQTAQDSADAAEVRRLLDDDMRTDLSGTRPFMREGKMLFHQRTIALVGRKLN
ncbi:MAG TPA: methyltransferase domain-containing protein [Candidatus Binataceae bacterium]|nr:methyltransferase domain-containing protein [Candidatus Binataceae bacterium]